MFWLIWFYFGLTFIHVSDSQRRALVDYSYVPPSTSSPSRNTPSEIPETSLNQIPKLATASSNFPRIDPTAVLEKKTEILNGRQSSPAKGDFAARPRSNKTGDTDARRTSPSVEIEKKPNDKDDKAHIPQASPSHSNERDKEKSTVSDRRGEIGSNSDGSIIPTRVTKLDLGNGRSTALDHHIKTLEEISPSAVLNTKLPDNDFASSSGGNSRDFLPNNSERSGGRDDLIHNKDRNIDDKRPKGDIRIIPESQPPSMDEIGLKNSGRDDKLSNSNTRRRGDDDKYDDREDKYRDRIPYDDYRPVENRKKEDDQYRPASTRNSRNQDRIGDEGRYVDDRRRGDIEKYGDKPYEDRYRDRIRADQRYPEERRNSDRYDDRGRRLNRDRSRLPLDDEYLDRYPVDERRNRGDFRDSPSREDRFRDRLSADDRRSAIDHDDERNKKSNGQFDRSFPQGSRSSERIPESRYREESKQRDDDRDYDGRKVIVDDEYRYNRRLNEDHLPPNRTRSRTDDRYNYQDKSLDSSIYDTKEGPYRGYSNDENSRFESKGAARDSIISSRTDYRPSLEETKATRQIDSSVYDGRYLSSDSRPYIKGDGDLTRDLGIENRERAILRDEESDKLPRDRRDRIVPTRVKDDRYMLREPNEDPYDSYERRIDRSYPDDRRRPAIIDTKYQNNDERSRSPTRTRIESSRNSPSSRREYYPSDEIKSSPKSENGEISLERRSYSSEDDEYKLSNTDTRSRTYLPDRTSYDDRRRDYRSDDPNKRYADEEEYDRGRGANVRNRDSIPRDGGLRYNREGNKEDRYRDISERDRNRPIDRDERDRDRPIDRDERDRDRPMDRDERDREQDRYNRNRDRFDDRRYEEDRYDRSRDRYDDRDKEARYIRGRDKYDDRDEEERYIRGRDRYDYRYKEDKYDQNRDGYVEDRYESGRYDRNRDRYDDSKYDSNRDTFRDDAKYEMSRSNQNKGTYNAEDRPDRSFELRPRDELSIQDDRIKSRDSSTTRSLNAPPARPEESFLPPSDVPETPVYLGVDNREMSSKDARRRDTSTSDYEADRPLSAKDVIDAALRQAESTELSPKKVFYPVFDPRISNLTSSDIIRPSERRGITITSRRRRRR